MKSSTRSILDEIDSLFVRKDKDHIIESRATHVIQGAINLINLIREEYDAETAAELERRMINSIKGQDVSKFVRGIKRVKGQ